MDFVDRIIAYESGEMDNQQVVHFFSELIKTGIINHLQGSYGHTAYHLIESGVLDPNGNIIVCCANKDIVQEGGKQCSS